MYKKIFFNSLFFLPLAVIAQPANDNCANAITLTVGSALTCGQNSTNATMEGSECFVDIAGATESSMWYRITATNDSLVLNFIQTNVTNLAPLIMVAGPYASGGGCLPACTSPPLYDFSSGNYQGTGASGYLISNGDYGNHMLLTGLSIGSDYLIRIQNNNGGGGNSRWVEFCINIQNPSVNSSLSGASLINQCGTSFSGATNGGYWNNGTTTGFNNLDGNAGTSCGSCTAGDDVPFIINNVSYFSFCATSNGTWNMTLSGIGSCQLADPNWGVQAAVFVGTPGNLTWIQNSPTSCGALGVGQVPPGCSWTSSNFTVNAGQCAYIAVDGFAGDACNYSVSLANVTGGCNVLPIELLSFTAKCEENKIFTNWETSSETNNDYFTVEKSYDGINWNAVSKINGAGNSSSTHIYYYVDNKSYSNTFYYRLKQTDFDGTYTYSNIVNVNCNTNNDNEDLLSVNQSNGSVDVLLKGIPGNKYKITLTNVLGQVIINKEVSLTDEKQKINITNTELTKGMYCIIMQTNNKIISKPLVINRN